MKFKYFLISLFVLISAVPLRTNAYIDPLGSATNPIKIEIVPDYFDAMASFRQQYGFDDYYFCNERSACSGNDLSNPYVQKTCLAYMRYCLQSMQNRRAICNGDHTLDVDGNCVSYDSICQNKYGQNSHFDEIVNGKTICDCSLGYEWYEHTCISIDQSCQKKFGQYSKSISNENGQNMCGCIDGYEMNSDRTLCIIKTVTQVEIKAVVKPIYKCFIFMHAPPKRDEVKVTREMRNEEDRKDCEKQDAKWQSDGRCCCNGQYDSANGKCYQTTKVEHEIISDTSNNTITCQLGTVYRDGFCLTPQQDCEKSYGPDAKAIEDGSELGYTCPIIPKNIKTNNIEKPSAEKIKISDKKVKKDGGNNSLNSLSSSSVAGVMNNKRTSTPPQPDIEKSKQINSIFNTIKTFFRSIFRLK